MIKYWIEASTKDDFFRLELEHLGQPAKEKLIPVEL